MSLNWKQKLTCTPVIARYNGPMLILLDVWMQQKCLDVHPSTLTEAQWKEFHVYTRNRLALLVAQW
jgi:hypothetical protein